MCTLDKKYNRKSFTGWKVVAVKDNNFYSPAMGCQYPMKGKVPIVKKQQRTCVYFGSHLLTHYSVGGAYVKEMTGRTMVFIRKRDAISLKIGIISDNKTCAYKDPHTYFIVRANVTNDLMNGEFMGCQVIAGKHIEFLLTKSQKKQFNIKEGE